MLSVLPKDTPMKTQSTLNLGPHCHKHYTLPLSHKGPFFWLRKSTTSCGQTLLEKDSYKGYLELSGFSVISFSDFVQLAIILSKIFSFASKSARSGKKNNPLPKYQKLELVLIDGICRQQFKYDTKIKICVGRGKKTNQSGIRRKCWLPAFSPSRTLFSKAFLFSLVKSRDCVVNS